MEKLTDIRIIINEKNLPDKEIELFWYGWKSAILNSLKNNKITDSKPYQLNLEKTSEILDFFQKKQQFNYIIDSIQQSMINHIDICIERRIDLYNTRILLSHIKRWKKIKYIGPKIFNIADIPNKFVLLEIYSMIVKDNNMREDHKIQMLDHIIFSDLEKLLNLAIVTNKSNIIDKLSDIFDVNTVINASFNTNFYPKTKASKILKIINK